MLPRILDADSTFLPPGAHPVAVERAQLTSTGVAVLTLAAFEGPPCAIIKVPMTPRATVGMEREGRALASLHSDERIGSWRSLLPRPLASGTTSGRSYRVDSVLPGRVMLGRVAHEASRDLVLAGAAESIHVLHRATATNVQGSERLAELWVDAKMQHIVLHDVRRQGRSA